MAKIRKMLSLDSETVDRLNQYAKDHHTNVSQAVTDWIWKQEVSDIKENKKESKANG